MSAGQKTRIQVVEDEAIIGMEIKRRLEKRDFEVVELVKTGKRAVEAAFQHKPDLILMDIALKGKMDGIDAAEQINKTMDFPIVFLTANADHATVERAKATGPFGYLIKPFDDTELATTIEMAIFKHQMEQDLRTAKEEAEKALTEVKRLQGLIPICSYCKNIRDDNDSWTKLEEYITEHSEASFSHGICPDCYREHIIPQLAQNK
ncbi:MAG: response regulator [Candidatus Marinimicrobia bacterium]|nr:response regulator [Candidatus Neomarinimicrobiota bacterium]